MTAERIKHYRQRLGWSVRQLAEECAKLGAPQLTEASLGNIERGPTGKRKRRDVSVDEIVVLGYALGVPLLLLMIPLGENDPLQITATTELHPHLAWKVMTGIEPLVVTGNLATRDSHEARVTVSLFDRLHDAQHAYEKARSRLGFIGEGGTERQREEANEAKVNALMAFAERVEAIHRFGLEVPAWSRQTLDDLTSTGIVTEPERLTEYVPPQEGDDSGRG